MATFDLPGVYTTYRENQLSMGTPTNTVMGDSILFIGFAADGPTFTPLPINRPQEAIDMFGGYSAPQSGSGYILPAVNEAYYAGARNLVGMRIGGLNASLALKEDELEGESSETLMTLYSKFSGKKYNNVTVTVDADNKQLHIWNVAAGTLLKSEEDTPASATFTLSATKTIAELAAEINAAMGTTDAGALVAEDCDDEPSTALASVSKQNLTGGSDEADMQLGSYSDEYDDDGNPHTIRGAVAKALSLLADYPVSFVVVLPLKYTVSVDGEGDYSVDTTDAYEMANFCYECAKLNNEVSVIMSASPFPDLSLGGIQKAVDVLATATNIFTAEGIDIGKYLSIVVGEGTFRDATLGITYTNTLAAAYAGLASTLPPQSGTTNKTLPNVINLVTRFSPPQIEKLRNNRFTTFMAKPNRGVVVSEGLLMSSPTSDFRFLSTMRVVRSVVSAIKTAVDPFIGEPLDVHHVNMIDTAIKAVLRSAVEQRAIAGGAFELFFGGSNAVIGDLDVVLELNIPSELRRIRVTVSRRVPNY